MTLFPDDQERLHMQAADWLIRCREDGEEQARAAGLDAWLARSPAHQRAWLSVCESWTLLGVLPPPTEQPVRKLARWPLALAAALALVMFAALWPQAPEFQTSRDGWASWTLADGTELHLAAGSAAAPGDSARELTLLRGELYLDVAPDPAHPFVLTVKDGPQVTVLGTAFNARRGVRLHEVSVHHGRVAVAADGAQVLLGAGDQVRVADGQFSAVQRVDVAQVGAWRQGQLHLDALPFEEAVAVLQRHLPGWFWQRDPLSQRPVSGVLDLQRPREALEGLAQTQGATLDYRWPGIWQVAPAR
ncbi:FecR family protein [Isoalcanivorax beigongshangi]|uniref:FecR domain-containing protein n=1 Tax=Isoalcanivorax beigongshangi TaxID=3238810 RepID=A0ABV4AK16_9GAMM